MGWVLLAMAPLAALSLVLLSRANEIFCVSVRGGRVLLVRGRIPASLLEDFADVSARARLERATLRAVVQRGAPRLLVRGAPDHVAQRLRNTFGIRSLAVLRGAPPARGRNLGQILGVGWLAWCLEDDLPR